MVFFFLSLGCFILQLMLIFSLFSFFVFSFNICLIHKEKHAFFHFFHSVFCIFSGLLFIFFSFGFGISGLKERADFFLYNLSTYGWVFLFYYFSFLYWFFSFFHMFAFLWFKMNWIVHLIWASGSFFLISTIFVNGQENTLPRKILLCPINWGTQWTMEISSNE